MCTSSLQLQIQHNAEAMTVLAPFLHQKYWVKSLTVLAHFLISMGVDISSEISVCTIVSLIESVILKGKHFDSTNPAIILCHQSSLLENIFRMKALNYHQMITILLTFIIPVPNSQGEIYSPPNPSPIPTPPNSLQTYQLSNSLTELFRSADLLSHPIQESFTYSQIFNLLRRYIKLRKYNLLDYRNSSVFLVGNDPLGKVFNVRAFHKRQFYELVKPHLL